MTEREKISRSIAAGESAGGSLVGWGGLHRRCRGSWPETAAATTIGPRSLTPRRSAGPAAQAGQAGGPAAAAGGGRGQAGLGVVAGADRRLVAAGYPQDPGAAGVARDDLAVAVHPAPGCAGPRAPALSGHRSGDALSAGQAAGPGTRSAARHPPHQPATRRGGRPGGARPLGRRPGLRQAAQRGGHLSRAPQRRCAAGSAPRGSDRAPDAAALVRYWRVVHLRWTAVWSSPVRWSWEGGAVPVVCPSPG
jgi:hypothetical protein